jgi:hypothetical protein
VRIILSRKGTDSKNGGLPSPIFPDGRMVSLPIEGVPGVDVTFRDLSLSDLNLGKVVGDLLGDEDAAFAAVHLDPDINRDLMNRPAGWRAAFGQARGAQTHLSNQGVTTGDLFIFFGWFRNVEFQLGRWKYIRGAPDLHVAFGWLQVAEIASIGRDATPLLKRYPWLARHPHVSHASDIGPSNTIYIAREDLELPGGGDTELSGAGAFRSFKDNYTLTWPGRTRSVWRLPKWFFPAAGRDLLSYHKNLKRWEREGEYSRLHTVCIGQEFVLNCNQYPESVAWAQSLIDRDSLVPAARD